VEFRPVPPPAPAPRTGTRVFMAFSKEANNAEAAGATKRQLAGASKACCTAVAVALCLAVVVLWQGDLLHPSRAAQAAKSIVSSNVSIPLRASKSLRTTVSGGDGGIVLGELLARRCSAPQEDCSATRCCSDPDLACYVKYPGYAGCMPSCGPGAREPGGPPGAEQWNCTLLEADPTPAPAAPDPVATLLSEGAAALVHRGGSEVHGVEPFLLKSVV